MLNLIKLKCPFSCV